jgi:glycosyltransferase involved in cell wall biosynthesis
LALNFEQIDLLIVPSILPDPLPTVVLEAMSSRKGVIATRQGGASEMIEEGETGYLIEIDNPSDSAMILHKVLSDAAHLKQLGANGFIRVKQLFTLDSFEKNWLKLFHRF